MPPKKKAGDPNKKTVEKQKAKVIEDKTFGMKNKKGTKQQKYIKMVTTQVQHGGKSTRVMDKEKQEKMSTKEKRQKELEELNALLRPVQQAPGKGADPKSVLCAFFKQGQCKKGDKCKFSHDLNISRKGEKRSMYTDTREDDNMENWDEQKLEEVVNKKHGESNKAKQTTTYIICKFFLEAVENSKYGWFWQCPNGENCKYRHALPPGFILKKDKKKEEKVEEISMEELVERERAALGDSLTKVTLETFLQWKERKRKEKVQKVQEENAKKKTDFKTGKMLGISGREMFTFNPDLVAGDDEGAEDIIYDQEEGEEVETASVNEIKEISIEALAAEAKEVDGTGTVAALGRKGAAVTKGNLPNGNADDESMKLGMAAALPPDPSQESDAAIAAALSATLNGDALAGDSPIDENLFDGEDLDLLEDELEGLELED